MGPQLTLSLPSQPRTGSWPLILDPGCPGPCPYYPLDNPALRPGATTRSQWFGERGPHPMSASALCSWLRCVRGGEAGQVCAPDHEAEERGCSRLTQSCQHYGKFCRQLSRSLSLTPNPGTENFSASRLKSLGGRTSVVC